MTIPAKDLLSALPEDQLRYMIDTNPSCRGLLTGYVAEQRLINELRKIPEISSIEKIKDHSKRKGDLLVKYLDKSFSIEVRCMDSNSLSLREMLLQGGISGKVSLGGSDSVILPDGTKSSCVKRGGFDILAVCTITVTDTWDFYFIHNKYLPISDSYVDRLKTSTRINTANTLFLYSDIQKVIPDIN